MRQNIAFMPAAYSIPAQQIKRYQHVRRFRISNNHSPLSRMSAGVRCHCEEGFSPTWQSHEQNDCFVATLLSMTIFGMYSVLAKE